MEKSSSILWKVGVLVLALVELSSATHSPTSINVEVVALVAIKTALTDPDSVLKSWNITSVDPCSWRMVNCSPDGYVSALRLPSQSLSGTLSPWIGNLTNLQSVSLPYNDISGLIPATIGKLEKLQILDLSYNKFNGEIPDSLGNLKNLNSLSLPYNDISGLIPATIGKLEKLQVLDLCYNTFNGGIPDSLGNLKNLNYLSLPHNDISGSIPATIGKLEKLQILDLSGNKFNGGIPDSLGNLKNLNSLSLPHNDISGSIPATIGKLEKLQILDLSYNKFNGGIPDSLGNLKNLNSLRLNNNSLTGPLPESLSAVEGLTLVDLSFNNLSGSLPFFDIAGNPLICGSEPGGNCSVVFPEPPSFPPDAFRDSRVKRHQVAIIVGTSFVASFIIVLLVALLLWWRYRHNKQNFFDVNDQYDPEVRLGHLRRYTFKELRAATDHFNSKNILGRGGFGIVFKGCLNDGTLVAVKRLKDYNTAGGERQFKTEVEISLALHRNLLRLCGFCSTENERLLVYPYMPNGSVASRLRDHINGRPALDWGRRKRIALGTARGLVYLHEQCEPKIIHRDVKAANILLDEDFEAVVGDFGLAKLLDQRDSHVTTAVHGTVGHIAPEYLSTGQSSEKIDIFGFGIFLLELITGQKALDFGRQAKQKGVMLDWVKKLHQEGKLNLMVDKDLKSNFDRVELEEMVQVALLCTQCNPSHRPKMSEVLKMLEGDGLAEKWEASQKVETPRF